MSVKFYQGIVVNTEDPNDCGRVQVYIPAIHDNIEDCKTLPWAVCGLYCEKNSIVIVGFENGNLSYPIVISVVSGGINELYQSGSLSTSSSSSSSGGIKYSSSDPVLSLTLWLVGYHETTNRYNLAMIDSDGYVSLGLIMFHTDNAKKLIDRIKSAYPSQYNTACAKHSGVSLPTGSWSKFRPTSAQLSLLRDIIDTSGGHTIQDEMGKEYINNYVETCTGTGITNPACVVYYCDYAVQNPSLAKKWAQTCVSKDYTKLDSFHSYWLSQTVNYVARRTDSYNYISKWVKEGKLTDSQDEGGHSGGGKF